MGTPAVTAQTSVRFLDSGLRSAVVGSGLWWARWALGAGGSRRSGGLWALLLWVGTGNGLDIYANICSVTSDGNPYVRFRRALASGSAPLVTAAALELPRISLDDALRICLVLREEDAGRYERAAVRWLGRFALEAQGVTIDDLRLAAEALDVLRARPGEAMERLQGLCLARGVG